MNCIRMMFTLEICNYLVHKAETRLSARQLIVFLQRNAATGIPLNLWEDSIFSFISLLS